jgi:hypothetical protein
MLCRPVQGAPLLPLLFWIRSRVRGVVAHRVHDWLAAGVLGEGPADWHAVAVGGLVGPGLCGVVVAFLDVAVVVVLIGGAAVGRGAGGPVVGGGEFVVIGVVGVDLDRALPAGDPVCGRGVGEVVVGVVVVRGGLPALVLVGRGLAVWVVAPGLLQAGVLAAGWLVRGALYLPALGGVVEAHRRGGGVAAAGDPARVEQVVEVFRGGRDLARVGLADRKRDRDLPPVRVVVVMDVGGRCARIGRHGLRDQFVVGVIAVLRHVVGEGDLVGGDVVGARGDVTGLVAVGVIDVLGGCGPPAVHERGDHLDRLVFLVVAVDGDAAVGVRALGDLAVGVIDHRLLVPERVGDRLALGGRRRRCIWWCSRRRWPGRWVAMPGRRWER